MQLTRWLTQKAERSSANKLAEFAGLQTPVARLTAFGAITGVVLVVPYERLEAGPELSLWARLGVPAWSIGLTRAYSKLLSGNVRGAFEQNPLIFPVVAVVGAIAAADVRALATKYRDSRRRASSHAQALNSAGSNQPES
ncbi:MAG: hypothetical protein DCC49_05190 [Acidobacteria bacterium]|nr:MAG: hypothetical protein DCC49_05190 [Acidobacteriota bacterium]